MTLQSRNLTLVVPGLLGPPGLRTADFSMLNCAALELLLSRAVLEAVPTTGLDASLFNLMGVSRDATQDLPIAAVTRLADGEDNLSGDGWWIRADPVHLRADQARLVLMDSHMLSITREEADAMAVQFNTFFADDGWCLEALHPQRWYLRLPQDPHIRTYDVTEVLGRHIDGFLPSGAQGKRWHTVLNEIQMLFHSSPVNQARLMRGAAPVNSVWLWGGGCLPQVVPAPVWSRVWSNEPVACGLARLAGIPHTSAPDSMSAWLTAAESANSRTSQAHISTDSHLIVLDEGYRDVLYGDASGWGAVMMRRADQWFAPLLDALKNRQLDSVSICPADGRMFRITPTLLRRFWKRRHSLETYV